MRGDLFFSGGVNLGDVLRTVAPMSAAVELTFSTRVFRFSAVLDAVSFFSAVEALVAPWRGCLSFALLFLIVPSEGADVVGFRSQPELRCLGLVYRLTRTSLLA